MKMYSHRWFQAGCTIGMVEEVVKFCPNLQLQVFPWQGHVLQQSRVLVIRSRLTEGIPGKRAVKGSVHGNFTSERHRSGHAITRRIIDRIDGQIEKAIGRCRIGNQGTGARRSSDKTRPRV